MSPIQAMERSYQALKQMLREGRFAPGARLEAGKLADDLAVSATPVRDALYRLVGERMVEASTGEGFHVPRQTEAELRDLYEWHSALVVIALRTATSREHRLPSIVGSGSTQADLTARMFDQIAAASPNREVHAAIAGAGDRLHPYRIAEQAILQPILGELEEVGAGGANQLQSVRRYHLRRIKAVPALIGARSGQ